MPDLLKRDAKNKLPKIPIWFSFLRFVFDSQPNIFTSMKSYVINVAFSYMKIKFYIYISLLNIRYKIIKSKYLISMRLQGVENNLINAMAIFRFVSNSFAQINASLFKWKVNGETQIRIKLRLILK